MSKKVNFWDNALAESFFNSLKTELVHHEKFLTRREFNKKIFEYIETFYNRQRLHSLKNYLSASDFKKKCYFLK